MCEIYTTKSHKTKHSKQDKKITGRKGKSGIESGYQKTTNKKEGENGTLVVLTRKI